MVYGPIAAMLVEMFPTRSATRRCRCRITSATAGSAASCPSIAFAIVAATGSIYSGLWYPIVVAVITLVIGMLFVHETKDVDIGSESLDR